MPATKYTIAITLLNITPDGVVQDDVVTDVDLVCDYYPGQPGRWYMPNGDPGYPDEPADVEIASVKYQGGVLPDTHPLAAYVLSKFEDGDAFYDDVEQKISEQLAMDYYDVPDRDR